MTHTEPRTKVVSQDVVERALASYRSAGGKDEHGMRGTLQSALQEGTFRIGDEVICHAGGLAGVIIEIHGQDAVISWASRGKSSEPVNSLEHVDHELPRTE